jgi:hypothetical protein
MMRYPVQRQRKQQHDHQDDQDSCQYIEPKWSAGDIFSDKLFQEAWVENWAAI